MAQSPCRSKAGMAWCGGGRVCRRDASGVVPVFQWTSFSESDQMDHCLQMCLGPVEFGPNQ
jgi:hypothetical protein